MKELESDDLAAELAAKPKTIVQFGASWCGNCRMLKPKFKRLAEQHPEMGFVYADAEKFPGTRSFAQVDNLPTFATYRGAELVSQIQGNKFDKVEELVHALAAD